MQTRSMSRRQQFNPNLQIIVPERESRSATAISPNRTKITRQNGGIKPFISNHECSDICIYTSQIVSPFAKYIVDIDFDEAHEAWKSNKCKTTNGCYVYKCMAVTKTGKSCVRKVYANSNYCKMHQSQYIPFTPENYVEVVESTGCCGL